MKNDTQHRQSTNPATRHWRLQHRMAMALIPLGIWLATAMAFWPGQSWAEFRGWLAMPRNAIPLLLFIAFASRHAALGLQVVLEDYVHPARRRLQAVRVVWLLLTANALAAILAILYLVVTAG